MTTTWNFKIDVADYVEAMPRTQTMRPSSQGVQGRANDIVGYETIPEGSERHRRVQSYPGMLRMTLLDADPYRSIDVRTKGMG